MRLLTIVSATKSTNEVALYCSILLLCVDLTFCSSCCLCATSLHVCIFSLYNKQKNKGEHQAKFRIGGECNEVKLNTVGYILYLHCYIINYRCSLLV
jgi:hypothetical protein